MPLQRTAAAAVVLAAVVAPAAAAPWAITGYLAPVVYTEFPATVIDGLTQTAYVVSPTVYITPTQRPIPSPLAVSTSVDNIYDITYINEYLPAGAGQTVGPYEPDLNDYFVALTYTAPASCPSPHWTTTYNAVAYVPHGVSVSPIGTVTEIGLSGPNLLIPASLLPSSTLSSLMSEYEPSFAGSCSIPYSYTHTEPSSYATGLSYGGGPDFSDCLPLELDFFGSAVGGGYACPDGDHWTWGVTLVGLICAWVFAFFGFFFIGGLLENWFTFRSLCRGRAARRGLPICFAFMFPFLSCFFLLGSRRGFMAKSREEQQSLEQRWNSLGGGTKFSQWLSWGFAFTYPPFLGPPPPHKGSAQPVYYNPNAPNAPPPQMAFQSQAPKAVPDAAVRDVPHVMSSPVGDHGPTSPQASPPTMPAGEHGPPQMVTHHQGGNDLDDQAIVR